MFRLTFRFLYLLAAFISLTVSITGISWINISLKTNERNGIIDFMRILRIMPSFDITEFGIEDVVRSGLVKEFLIAKDTLGL